MGSYLTIVNDTPDRWQCKIGIDERGLKFSSFFVALFGGVMMFIAALGFAGPLTVSTLVAGGTVSIFGVAPTSLVPAIQLTAYTTNLLACTSFFTLGTANLIGHELSKRGYVDLAPGAHHRYGKMSLGLWQQCECIRTTTVDEKTLWVDKLIMRPIFSGMTINSNKNYSIKAYLHRNNTVERTVVAAKSPVRRQLEQTKRQDVFELLAHKKFYNRKGELVDLSAVNL